MLCYNVLNRGLPVLGSIVNCDGNGGQEGPARRGRPFGVRLWKSQLTHSLCFSNCFLAARADGPLYHRLLPPAPPTTMMRCRRMWAETVNQSKWPFLLSCSLFISWKPGQHRCPPPLSDAQQLMLTSAVHSSWETAWISSSESSGHWSISAQLTAILGPCSEENLVIPCCPCNKHSKAKNNYKSCVQSHVAKSWALGIDRCADLWSGPNLVLFYIKKIITINSMSVCENCTNHKAFFVSI